MKVRLADVPTQRDALKALAELGERATMHPAILTAARQIVSECEQRDDMCEITAIFNAVKHGDSRVKGLEKGLRYVADPRWADAFMHPARTLQQCRSGACGGDCLPAETLLLRSDYQLIAISEIKVGDRIMGDGRWVEVTNTWDKGVQDTLEFNLSNGCTLRCTENHKLFVLRGDAKRGEEIEIRASEVRPGDTLLTPEKIPFGVEDLGPDRSYLLGIHVAEGWVDFGRDVPTRVSISGLDGYRKEANKHRVVEICERLGADTRWHQKYVAINNKELAGWLSACGRGSINKHFPTLNFTEDTIATILEGLNNDADQRDGVFSTISPTLALQYRLMLRMQGVSTHITRVEAHGGFGKNPIYRVTPRKLDSKANAAKVKSIGVGGEAQTFDIEVEGHRFYLPESDTVVHNCDDAACLLMALLGAVGFRVGLRAWGPTGCGGDYTHVYALVGYPKRNPETVIPLDTTVPESSVGWEPPNGEVLNAWAE